MTKHIQKGDLSARTAFASGKLYHGVGWRNSEAERFVFFCFQILKVSWDAGQMTSHLWVTFGTPFVKWGHWIKISLMFLLVPSCMLLIQNRILHLFVLSRTGSSKVWWPNHRENISHKIILQLICMYRQFLLFIVLIYTNSSPRT